MWHSCGTSAADEPRAGSVTATAETFWGGPMTGRRERLTQQRVLVGLSQEGLAEQLGVDRGTITRWETGRRAPQAYLRPFLAQALQVSLTDLDVLLSGSATGLGESRVVPWDSAAGWEVDTLAGLADLGSSMDLTRRGFLGASAFSAAVSTLPDQGWWAQMVSRSLARAEHGVQAVGRGDLDAVREAVAFFSRMDQRHGGGHARAAVVQYLTGDVTRLLNGRFADDGVRRGLFSAASELAYVAGWMAFDNAEHGAAQRLFTTSVKLAAEADDAAMAAHTLRAMAHQAVDLGHPSEGLALGAASMSPERYGSASPRERALLGVVHARGLAATGQAAAASAALVRAEDDLAAAAPDGDEPARVFFFGEASLAHETGRTLHDIGDLAGAERALEHSVRTREAEFARTHAVTLGYLGAVQERQGELDQACATWSTALDAMAGVQSARARQTVVDLRVSIAPYKAGHPEAALLDERAGRYLATVG